MIGAASAEEGLAVLDEQSVDVLFSDVVMPGKSGVELARIVRERLPDLPVLLASGYSEEIIGGAAAEFEIIRKPYGAEQLAAGLERVLAGASADRQ